MATLTNTATWPAAKHAALQRLQPGAPAPLDGVAEQVAARQHGERGADRRRGAGQRRAQPRAEQRPARQRQHGRDRQR